MLNANSNVNSNPDSTFNSDSDNRILIAGGGLGGLACAVALQQAGIETVVLERARHLRAAGCGVHLWTNATLVLDDLGLGEQLREIARSQNHCEFGLWNGRKLADWPVHRFVERHGAPVVAIGRDDLVDLLGAQLKPGTVRTEAEVVHYVQDDEAVTVTLADGEELRGAALVGADGINSAVRRQLLGPSPADYAGYIAWRAAVDMDDEDIPDDQFRCLFGRGGTRFVYYRIAPGRMHWMSVANGPAGGRDDQDPRRHLLERHKGWADPVERILRATLPDAIIRTDVYDRGPDRRWGEGRVTLIGDAAHPMNFNVGQGACQALEDAVALATHLRAAATTHTGPARATVPTDIPAALRAYEAHRRPRTASMQRAARAIGRMNAWENRLAFAFRNALFRAAWGHLVFPRLDAEIGDGARWTPVG